MAIAPLWKIVADMVSKALFPMRHVSLHAENVKARAMPVDGMQDLQLPTLHVQHEEINMPYTRLVENTLKWNTWYLGYRRVFGHLHVDRKILNTAKKEPKQPEKKESLA